MQIETIQKNSHLTDSQKLRFRLWLQKKLSDRSSKNPRYSLRAFANFLGLDASTVSQMLSGKRSPSREASLAICEKLSAIPQELSRLGLNKSIADSDDDFYQLSMDTFSVLSDWYHFAILELSFTKDQKSDPKWIASRIGISITDANAALERLLRLDLLQIENGKLLKTHVALTNHTGINTSVARKTLQKQIISKALNAVDEVAQEKKDITSMTMAIDLKNLDRARELTKQYRREMCALLEDGSQSQVYNLAIQLYPVTKE